MHFRTFDNIYYILITTETQVLKLQQRNNYLSSTSFVTVSLSTESEDF